MADFITQEFTFRAVGTLILNDIHNLFVEGIRNITEKHYDLTSEDIMSDNSFDNQKDSIDFLSKYISQYLKGDEDGNQDNKITCICDCCGKKYIRLFDNYELCPDCEKTFYNQACREDYINWFKPIRIKNKIELEIGTQRDISF